MTIDSEAFVMWAAKMATDFADGKTWRTGQFRAKLDHLIAQEAKAFGGCRNCYGKGYATVISGTKGYADFGGDGFQTPPTTHIKYCSCDRGKQLKQVVAQEATRARIDEIKLLIGTHNNDPSVKQHEVISVTRALLNERIKALTADKEPKR